MVRIAWRVWGGGRSAGGGLGEGIKGFPPSLPGRMHGFNPSLHQRRWKKTSVLKKGNVFPTCSNATLGAIKLSYIPGFQS